MNKKMEMNFRCLLQLQIGGTTLCRYKKLMLSKEERKNER